MSSGSSKTPGSSSAAKMGQSSSNPQASPKGTKASPTGGAGKNTRNFSAGAKGEKPKGYSKDVEVPKGRVTRGTTDGDHEKEKEKYQNMSREEKRKHYKCGSKFTTLDMVKTWKDQAPEIIGREAGAGATTPKKKKSSTTLIAKDEKKTYQAKDDLNMKVSIWKGDITTLEIDAIVNAANNSLLGGGGVDGAIHSAAGSLLKRECAKLKGCDTGDAKITLGYDLPAKHVIHTVGPIGEKPKDLKSCYIRSLTLMKENNLTSIAFPCISTGIYGYENSRAAPVVMRTIREWLEEDEYGPQVERVIFCLFMPEDVSLYESGMQVFFPLENRTGQNGEKSGQQEGKEEMKMDVDESNEDSGSKEKDDKLTQKTDKKEGKGEKSVKDKRDNSPSKTSENNMETKDEGLDQKNKAKQKAKKGADEKGDNSSNKEGADNSSENDVSMEDETGKQAGDEEVSGKKKDNEGKDSETGGKGDNSSDFSSPEKMENESKSVNEKQQESRL